MEQETNEPESESTDTVKVIPTSSNSDRLFDDRNIDSNYRNCFSNTRRRLVSHYPEFWCALISPRCSHSSADERNGP